MPGEVPNFKEPNKIAKQVNPFLNIKPSPELKLEVLRVLSEGNHKDILANLNGATRKTLMSLIIEKLKEGNLEQNSKLNRVSYMLF